MARTIELTLGLRGATCAAELLDVAAPRTCDAIWEALPIVGPLWHTKTAGNEVYTLLPAFSAALPIEMGAWSRCQATCCSSLTPAGPSRRPIRAGLTSVMRRTSRASDPSTSETAFTGWSSASCQDPAGAGLSKG